MNKSIEEKYEHTHRKKLEWNEENSRTLIWGWKYQHYFSNEGVSEANSKVSQYLMSSGINVGIVGVQVAEWVMPKDRYNKEEVTTNDDDLQKKGDGAASSCF